MSCLDGGWRVLLAEGKGDRLEFGPHSKQVDAAYQQSVTDVQEVRPTADRSSD